jgi:hypothetical protein
MSQGSHQDMSEPTILHEANSWAISGIRSAEKFFLAIAQLVPEATHVFLEGSPDADVVALLSVHAASREYFARAGTFWSWPRRNQRFSLCASFTLFSALAEAASRHAEPEICDHLHVYRDDQPLVEWFDAFLDPVLISKAVPRVRVEQFCSAVDGVLSDATARPPA